ncbi:MAG: response regulator [Clostridiales bacterium]|nr:response regulator [Clostridiales bacterium]
MLLQGILKKEYNVVEAENSKDAFEKLRQHKDIAAILVDIIMPVMDGYTFLRKLKKSEFSSLPVSSGASSIGIDTQIFVPNPI